MKSKLSYIISTLCFMLLMVVSCADHDLELLSENGSIIISVSENPLNVSCDYNEFSFVVHSKCKGVVLSTSNSWIELGDSILNDTIGTISFCVQPNKERYARVGTIRVSDILNPGNYATLKIRQAGTTSSTNATMTNSMERQHRLGWGYDIMKSYMNDKSFSTLPLLNYAMIVDAEKRLNTTIITENRRYYEELETVTGTTHTELQSKLTKHSDEKCTFLGCGTYTTFDSTFMKRKTIDEECGLVRLKQICTSRTVDMGMLYTQNLSITDGASMLSEDFREKLVAVSKTKGVEQEKLALEIIKAFGTHLVVSADLGGAIDLHTTTVRSFSVNTEHSTKTVAKMIFGKKRTPTSSEYEKVTKDEDINYRADIQCYGGDDKIRNKIIGKVERGQIIGEITDDEILQWQESFNIDASTSSGSYKAALVSCRLVPIYYLVQDPDLKSVIQTAYNTYTGTPAETSDEQPNGKINMSDILRNWKEKKNCYVQTINVTGKNGKETTAIVCKEYVPCLYGDRQCVVAYPIVNGKPFLYCGFFPGDKEHRPGMIRWVGNGAMYEPNDSVCMEDSKYKHLFDEETGALKTLYLYWNGVQAIPKDYDAPDYPTSLGTAYADVSAIAEAEDASVELVKVGSYFWADHSLCLQQKHDWTGESGYSNTGNRSSITENGNCYNLCVTIPSHIYYEVNKNRLPTTIEAQSVMKTLGGRGDMMGKEYENGYNILGLKWVTGFKSIFNGNSAENTVYDCDTDSWLVLTYDGVNLLITRLSGAGNAVTYKPEDYFPALSNADLRFFKYLPLYYCTSKIRSK